MQANVSRHITATEPPLHVTGFEKKSLRVVIENWLYTEDLSVLMDATSELRRRFRKTFPRPAWMGASK